MVIFSLNKKTKHMAAMLFSRIVKQARRPEFYQNWQVADTLDGRFDLIVMHMSLVVNRLHFHDLAHGKNKKAALMIRYLQEALFDNMDMSLRELGVGDLSVGKKVKIMAEAYYGRVAAYGTAIKSSDVPDDQTDDQADNLAAVLTRNIYRGQAPDSVILDCFVSYVNHQVKYLANLTNDDIMASGLIFENVI